MGTLQKLALRCNCISGQFHTSPIRGMACLVLSKITEPLERLQAERHNTAPARQQQPNYEEVRCISVRRFLVLVVLWLTPVGSISTAAQSRVDRVYFVAEMSRVGSEVETIIEVEAVGLEFGHSAHARACFQWGTAKVVACVLTDVLVYLSVRRSS